jgi:metal-responsive CopG/Arc/MetJ family transcriptional regulator
MDEEKRTERFSVSLRPSLLSKLDAFARENHWTRSTAAAVLIEEGLDEQEEDQDG